MKYWNALRETFSMTVQQMLTLIVVSWMATAAVLPVVMSPDASEDREVALASAPDGWVTASVPATVPAVVPETHPVGPGMNISAD
jgi:hypothetical protein